MQMHEAYTCGTILSVFVLVKALRQSTDIDYLHTVDSWGPGRECHLNLQLLPPFWSASYRYKTARVTMPSSESPAQPSHGIAIFGCACALPSTRHHAAIHGNLGTVLTPKAGCGVLVQIHAAGMGAISQAG